MFLVASERDDTFTVIRPRFLCKDMGHDFSLLASAYTFPSLQVEARLALSVPATCDPTAVRDSRLGTDSELIRIGWGHPRLLPHYCHHRVFPCTCRAEVVQKYTHSTAPELQTHRP